MTSEGAGTPSFPGPDALGRGVFLPAGQTPPAGFNPDEHVVVDGATLADPEETARRLHAAWLGRRRVLVELDVDLAELTRPTVIVDDLWDVSPGLGLWRETLNFAAVVNSYDCRGDRPVWHKAERLCANRADVAQSDTADVVLADGRAAWLDGGPRVVPPDWDCGAGEAALVSWESLESGRLTEMRTGRDTAAAGLTDEQSRASTHAYGAARVIACAGSGKTTTLVARLRHLVCDLGIEPDLVCAVAFNRLAARQMASRFEGHDSEAAIPRGLSIRTFHSLAYAIVQDGDGDRQVLDDGTVRRLLRAAGAAPNYERLDDPLAGWIEALTQVRLALRDPEVVEAEGEFEGLAGFARVFHEYRNLLQRQRAVDYDEMAFRATELLLADPALRTRWSRRCRHLVVDEFQDLTPTFVLMLRALTAPVHNVWGCGDDDQVLYEFAGADPRFLVEFDSYFPAAVTHRLQTNFRCPVRVVTAAESLLDRNTIRVEKSIRPAPGARPDHAALEIVLDTPRSLPQRCARIVQGWVEEVASPDDVCILARTNIALFAPQAALVRAGIAVRSPLRVEVLARPAVAALLAWLRIAMQAEPFTTADLTRVVARPTRYLTRQVRDSLDRRPRWTLSELWDWQRGLGGYAAKNVAELLFDVKAIRQAGRRGATTLQLLDTVIHDFGYADRLDADEVAGPSRTGADVGSDRDDIDALRAVAELHDDPRQFEMWLQEVLAARAAGDRGDVTGGRPAVTLSSVHRVKGREWGRVVVYGADRGLMPHRLCQGSSDAVEAERRILHVAITRARDELKILARVGRHSPFLEEMDAELAARVEAGPGLPAIPGGRAVPEAWQPFLAD